MFSLKNYVCVTEIETKTENTINLLNRIQANRLKTRTTNLRPIF